MKPVHLFWTPKNTDLAALQMGWLHLKYHLFSWVLSAHSIRKFYPKLELITDDFGEEVLVNELKLPYTSVRKDYEGLDLGYPDSIWAAKKMYGYTLHQEPFINFDGDVFIWEEIPTSIHSAPLCAQNMEVDVPFYFAALKDIKLHFKNKPDLVKKILGSKKPLIASNAGILGANNLEFIKAYVQYGFDFLNKNLKSLQKVNKGNQNIIIEQLFFYELAQMRGIHIEHLINEPTTSRQFPHLTNFTALPNRCKYIHIMGGKKYPSTCEQLEQRVLLEYPDAYDRVLHLLKKHELALNTFFFNQQEMPVAVESNLSTIEEKPLEQSFARTWEIIKALKLRGVTYTNDSTSSFIQQVQKAMQIGTLSEPGQKVLQEVLQFEADLLHWRSQLPNLPTIEAQKRDNAQKLDQALRQGEGDTMQAQIKLNPYAFIWDCEWNWAEKKEFKQQVENSTPYRNNLKMPPSYFRIIAFVYPQQGIVREYLADPLSVILLDVLEDGAAKSMAATLAMGFDLVKQLNAEADEEHKKRLLDQLTFLTYQGVLLIDETQVTMDNT
jgi:hypothetical protein